MEALLVGLGGTDAAHVLMRVAVGTFFLLSGYHKLFVPSRHSVFVQTLYSCHVPAPLVLCWPLAMIEFLGGLALVVGFLAPLAAAGLLAILVVATVTDGVRRVRAMSPLDTGDMIDDYLYLPEVVYSIVLVYLITTGSGPLSLDAWTINHWMR